jgi:Nucleotidyl transferase AbiEii toxin, Type IV TA system
MEAGCHPLGGDGIRDATQMDTQRGFRTPEGAHAWAHLARGGFGSTAQMAEYSDFDGDAYVINVYSLVEIWAEKTRSLMQRSEPRDLYDLDQLLTEDGTLPDLALGLFQQKSRRRTLIQRPCSSVLGSVRRNSSSCGTFDSPRRSPI